MTPHKQLFRHNPEAGIFGDCVRTAIACLLDVEPAEVPHHHGALPDGEQSKRIDDWLSTKGLSLVFMAFPSDPQAIMDVMGAANPRVFYMLSGTSRNGCNHVVICRGNEIVHDPSLDDSGIVGPCSNGHTYVELMVPSFLTAAL